GAAQIFWSRYFTVSDTLNQSRPYQEMIARQIELLDPHPGDRTLDAGTGSGNLAAALGGRGARVTGVDFCEPAFELPRRKAPARLAWPARARPRASGARRRRARQAPGRDGRDSDRRSRAGRRLAAAPHTLERAARDDPARRHFAPGRTLSRPAGVLLLDRWP